MSKKSTALLLLFALLAGTTAAPAQPQKPGDKPLPGDEMIYKYLCAETDKLSAKFRLAGCFPCACDRTTVKR